jgi:ABC-2 type transport system ATP-binding protein
MTTILEFAGVTRAYGKMTVLDGVTAAMQAGEVTGLLGRNGAGKTTLIHIAMGMLSPHGGSVRVFGLDPVKHPVEVKRRIGYVAEDQVFPPLASVSDLLEFHQRVFPSWDAALEKELVERFALHRKMRVAGLSKGQARQLALVCAVCHRPELLVLDEPAAGLDPAARREFLETSIQLLNAEGTAILFSSHHLGDVERLGGRIILLDKGRIALDRDLDAIREDHCIAIVPRSAVRDVKTLEALHGCKRVRAIGDEYHLVFQGTPETVRWAVAESLGVNDVVCRRVPLEELFVELVGQSRPVEAGR